MDDDALMPFTVESLLRHPGWTDGHWRSPEGDLFFDWIANYMGTESARALFQAAENYNPVHTVCPSFPSCQVVGADVYRAEAHEVTCHWMMSNTDRCNFCDELLRPDMDTCHRCGRGA